jgi:hypothetical protein
MRYLDVLEDGEKLFGAQDILSKTDAPEARDDLALAFDISPIQDKMAVSLIQIRQKRIPVHA